MREGKEQQPSARRRWGVRAWGSVEERQCAYKISKINGPIANAELKGELGIKRKKRILNRRRMRK